MRSLIVRSIKTFVAAFISTITLGLSAMAQTGFDAWETTLAGIALSGVCAGVTAVMNIPAVKKFFKDYGEPGGE